jgi:diguanylate cyclase (GGDEF)-like protein
MLTPADRRLLVVDDDEDTLAVVREALVQQGYAVETATSAQEALELVKRVKPHLVITDHDMPELNGLEMLKRLRQDKNYVTVIFISGRGDSQLVAHALRTGADDFIRKPFRFDEFLARVEAALRDNDIHKELRDANEKLQDMVETDYLTGLYNMRSMYEKIDFEIKRAKRFKRNVSAVMLDMDHFKTVNDTNDHLFGSFVLKEVGEIIRGTMREVDFAARYGGDEFLIVLTETNAVGTRIFCERLQMNIKAHEFNDGRNKIRLTVSIGFAVMAGGDEMDARQLVRAADHALYRAKTGGRDRVSE